MNSILVHPKFGQKRSEPGSVPSSTHHSQQQQQAAIPAGYQPSHPNHMTHPHATSYKSPNNLQSSSSNRSNEQSFAAALRSLAKQQIDVKDEEMIQQGGEGKNSSNNPRMSEKEHEANRQSSTSRGIQYDNRPTDMRNLTSPQPPDKKVSVVQRLYKEFCQTLLFLDPPNEQWCKSAFVGQHPVGATCQKWLPALQTRRTPHSSSRSAVSNGRHALWTNSRTFFR